MVEFTISKAKVGPLLKRYSGGKYKDVDQEHNDSKRVAVLGLDNSHNKDYKVDYASDPLVVVEGSLGYSHSEIKEAMEKAGLFELGNFHKIQTPTGTKDWKNGYKTTPMHANMFERMREKCEQHSIIKPIKGKNVSTVVIE